ncbi:MAG TPA: ribonuclease HII [Candidatus Saccharimonadales bacterium]|nr:ribonuclease HII [Candidatus Saccharimonadales bacterium]
MIVGIDEVGRGCWAGPLVAAAVALAEPIPGLKDSKKLSKAQRERLSALVYEKAQATGIGWVSPVEIDQLGLTAAVRLAMRRALEAITAPYDRVIIDGNLNFLSDNPKTEALIKADDLIPAVSAASIIAKVARDNYMAALKGEYQKYDFAKHVGYGTALHRQLLVLHGVSDIHRRSFKPIAALLASQA